jgi:putative transposase
VPRDRQARFDPQLIAKYQRRFPGFDEKIISMYARGMSTRQIVGHLRDLYGIEVSPDLISAVTDAVLEEVAAWQARPLEPVYPLIFFDALRVKVRDEGLVRNKAVHIALGVRADGTKEILGLWLEQNEAFEEGYWGKKYPAIGQSWRRAWAEVVPFYAFPGEVRRILYTTNAIEALNAKLRRAVRVRGHFPSDDAATKLLFLVLNRSEKQWIMPPREWSIAKSQFAVLFGERFTMAMA